jgi:hypothetical protein
VGLAARRGIAKGAGPGLNDVAVLLLAEFLDERGPLDGPQLAADPDGQEIVDRDLADVGVRRIAEIVAGVEAAAKTCFGKKLPGPVRIEFGKRRCGRSRTAGTIEFPVTSEISGQAR